MMNDNKITIEQTVDILIEGARKTSNTLMLETAKLIKAALINNQHSEKPVSELDVLHKMVKEREKAMDIYEKAGRKDLALKKLVIFEEFPTAQKGTIVKIFKSIL